MSDNLQNRGGQDRSRIAINQDHEVRYWTEALGIEEEELRRAIEAVGNSAEAVRDWLSRPH
jgi:hypothetical protein